MIAEPIEQETANLRALNDSIIVALVKLGKTIGGVHMPDTVKRQVADEGIVFAVGPGAWHPTQPYRDEQGELQTGVRKPMEVKIGDHVLLRRMAGTEVTHRGERFVQYREADIAAVEEEIPDDEE